MSISLACASKASSSERVLGLYFYYTDVKLGNSRLPSVHSPGPSDSKRGAQLSAIPLQLISIWKVCTNRQLRQYKASHRQLQGIASQGCRRNAVGGSRRIRWPMCSDAVKTVRIHNNITRTCILVLEPLEKQAGSLESKVEIIIIPEC